MSGPILLVVDDVHKAAEDGGQLLARLAQIGPPWLRIAFAGRGAPPEIVSTAAAGRLPSWGAQELLFSRDETREYLRQLVASLDDERADLLHDRSEGWPGALAVIRAWLAANAGSTIETLIEMTRGDRHRIYRVFASDYFSHLSDRVRHDLLVSSLAVSLNATIAQHLLGADGGMRLRALADGPYFLAEDRAGTFRLHSLFREFLGQRWIDERGRASLQAARSSLARWYQEGGDMASAYQVALEAENWEIAIAAIEPLAPALANRGDAGFLREILSSIPDERIYGSRPIRESWVRALVATGAPNALEEPRALAAADAPSVVNQAIADLVLVELEHDLGLISDQSMADTCDGIAARVGGHDVALSLSARLLSLLSRSFRNPDPAQWPALLREARRLTDTAEAADLFAIAADAGVVVADLANRVVQDALRSDVTQLRMMEALGGELALEDRVARARHFIALADEVIDLFQAAFRTAEKAESHDVLARVQLTYARFLTLNSSLAVVRSGNINESTRKQLESAIEFAMGAAHTYSGFGAPRNVVIALNVAAQAASALDERTRRAEFTQEAARIATQFGYHDLASIAIRIGEEPTAMERHRWARSPLSHRSPAQVAEVIEAMIAAANITQVEADLVRPLLRRELADRAKLDAQRGEVCQYLKLLQDLTGPRIGPFFLELDWSLTCRMRGMSSVSRHPHAEPLLREFTTGVCSTCEFRSPGAIDRCTGPEEIYAPLFERLDSEEQEATGDAG